MAIYTLEESFIGYQPVSLLFPATNTLTLTGHIPTGVTPTLEIAHLSLLHTFIGDLDVTLTNPDGDTVTLFTDIGGTDSGLIDITLSDAAAIDIGTVNNPTDGENTGTFNPEGAALLSSLVVGNLIGDWQLKVTDDSGMDDGHLLSWFLRLTFDYSGTVSGTNAIDTLGGSDFADKMFGLGASDTISAFSGNDFITGGRGGDRLSGGTGADDFIYRSTADSRVNGGRDKILDFSRAEGDDIVLSAIDANTKLAGNQAFSFIGAKAFSGKAGELRALKIGADSHIYADINGDRKVDMHIVSDIALRFFKEDFVL